MDGIWDKKQKGIGETEGMEQAIKLPWEMDEDTAGGVELFQDMTMPEKEEKRAEEGEGMEKAEEKEGEEKPGEGMEKAEEEGEERLEAGAKQEEEAKILFRELKEENRKLQQEVGTLKDQVAQIGEDTRKLASGTESVARQLNQVNENLHKENLELKEGLYDTLALSVLRDVVDVASDMMMDIRRYEKNEGHAEAEAVKSSLEDLHVMLEKHGVTVYQAQPGEKYEPIRQRIIKTIDIEEEAKERVVAKAAGYGYIFRKEDGTEKVLAPCKVSVYKMS